MRNHSGNEIYKLDSSGKLRVWMMDVYQTDDGEVYQRTLSGLDEGKCASRKKLIEDSSRETGWDRAVKLQANAYEKKIREGYFKTKQQAEDAGTLFKVMKAQKYTLGMPLRIDFYVQPKINGARAPYDNRVDKIYTKTNLEYFLPHVKEELKRFADILELPVDGEIYVPGLTAPEIVGVCKRMDDPRRKDMEYWVYDCMNDEPFGERWGRIEFARSKYVEQYGVPKYLRFVQTVRIRKIDAEFDLERWYHQFLYEKWEGLMIRINGPGYEYGRRSPNLLKWKPVMDAEFRVKHVTYERREHQGVLKWLVEFHCECEAGVFKAVPKWDVDRRYAWYLKYKDDPYYVDDLPLLTCEYRELTKNGLPFHAVAIDFRDMDY